MVLWDYKKTETCFVLHENDDHSENDDEDTKEEDVRN